MLEYMGAEELGSVYESLLELVPQVRLGEPDPFRFIGDVSVGQGGAEGNARRLSGSYYTPDSLVQVLLDSALEPVIADTIAKNPDNTVEALLGLSIVDPACGSGNFLYVSLELMKRLEVEVLEAFGDLGGDDLWRADDPA